MVRELQGRASQGTKPSGCGEGSRKEAVGAESRRTQRPSPKVQVQGPSSLSGTHGVWGREHHCIESSMLFLENILQKTESW